MDDWYVTRALLNATNVTYVNIGKHYISTNNVLELGKVLQKNSTLRYEPIFGHFRSNKRYHFLNLKINVKINILKI